MIRRLARWIVRDELEQAHTERAEAVNHAINMQGWMKDCRDVSNDRANALRAALRSGASVPDDATRTLEGMDMTFEQKRGAIHEIEFFRPGGWIDKGKAMQE